MLRRSFLGTSSVSPDAAEDASEVRELLAAGNRISTLLPWISPFTNLRVLDVRHNCLASCSGIEACVRLNTLDLRDNQLASGAELTRDLSSLGRLQTCDARYNPFSEAWSHAEAMLAHPGDPVPLDVQEARMAWRSSMLRTHDRLSMLDGMPADAAERAMCCEMDARSGLCGAMTARVGAVASGSVAPAPTSFACPAGAATAIFADVMKGRSAAVEPVRIGARFLAVNETIDEATDDHGPEDMDRPHGAPCAPTHGALSAGTHAAAAGPCATSLSSQCIRCGSGDSMGLAKAAAAAASALRERLLFASSVPTLASSQPGSVHASTAAWSELSRPCESRVRSSPPPRWRRQ